MLDVDAIRRKRLDGERCIACWQVHPIGTDHLPGSLHGVLDDMQALCDEVASMRADVAFTVAQRDKLRYALECIANTDSDRCNRCKAAANGYGVPVPCEHLIAREALR